MAIGKWIGGLLGFASGGVLGALAGFALGSLFDSGIDAVNSGQHSSFDGDRQGRGYGGDHGQSQRFRSNSYQRQYNSFYNEERNSFLFSLLVLASYIIKADGKVMHSEMEFVRKFLRSNFGESAVVQGQEILYKLFEKQKEIGWEEYRTVIQDSGRQIASSMPYEQRLQLLHFLAMIAQADGIVHPSEVSSLKEVAQAMEIPVSEIDAMLNLRAASSNLDAAYKVMGVSPSATDAEVKAAYRKQALQNHPDRVASLGEDIRKAAEKKFQEINAAKETIWKARGLS